MSKKRGYVNLTNDAIELRHDDGNNIHGPIVHCITKVEHARSFLTQLRQLAAHSLPDLCIRSISGEDVYPVVSFWSAGG